MCVTDHVLQCTRKLQRPAPIVVAPEQLKHNPIGGLVAAVRAFSRILLQLRRYQPRRQTPGRQPRRELGREVGAEHAVARVKVRARRVRTPEVVLQPSQSRPLAAPRRQRRLLKTSQDHGKLGPGRELVEEVATKYTVARVSICTCRVPAP